MFTKGNKLAKGGARKGSGKPPDWLRIKCQRLISDKKIVERLASIAAGELMDTTTLMDCRLIPVPAPMQAQVKAAQELLDRGFGKPVQSIMPVDDKGKFTPYSLIVKIDDGKSV